MPFLCVECLSKIDPFIDPPVDDQLHLSILSHLRNGSTPSTNQHIDAFLADAPDNLSAYDEVIAETEIILSSLKSARKNLQLRIDNARSLISAPIRQLPAEVLNEIFTFYCRDPSDPSGCILVLDSRVHFPTLILSWVCSSWRTSLHSRQDLWSSMKLSSWLLHSPGMYQIFLIYITYSGENLLDFEYDVSSLYGTSTNKVTSILLNNSKRWRRVTLYVPKYSTETDEAQIWLADFVWALSRMNTSGSESPIPQPEENFPALEYAVIHSLYLIPWPAAFLNFLQTFSLCPRLHTLSLSDFTWAGHNINLSHITNLSLGTFSGRSFGHLLCRLPLLNTLKVDSFQLSEDEAGDMLLQQKGYWSSTLSKLDISLPTFRDMEAWNFLRLPCLTSLKISNGYTGYSTGSTTFSSMLLQSECKVQTLVLHYRHCLEILDSIAFELSEYIINLTISFGKSDDIKSFTEFGPLRPREDGSCLFPNLRCLSLHLSCLVRSDAVCFSHIGNLLHSRIIAEHLEPSGLQTVMISGRELRSAYATSFMTCPDTLFVDLRRAGLNVEIVDT